MQPGQWSRPLEPLIRGVRPNSPQTSTRTRSARPRSCRSSTRAGHGGVERRELAAAAREDLAVMVPAVLDDRDERHARLDEPARQQARLPDPGPAVAVVRREGLGREVERLASLRAGDPRECLGGKPVQTLHHPRGIAATLESVELGKQVAAVGESVESQAIGRVEVADLRPAEQVALDWERVEAGAEVGRLAERRRVRDGDVGRHAWPAGPSDPGGDRADARAVVASGVRLGRGEARHDPVRARAVVGRRVVQAPDDRQLVHDPRLAREQLADRDAGDIRRDRPEFAPEFPGRVGLQVVGIDVAGAAPEKDLDDGRVLPPPAGGRRPRALSRSKSLRVSPPRPSVPTRRKLRRLAPSPVLDSPPSIASIVHSLGSSLRVKSPFNSLPGEIVPLAGGGGAPSGKARRPRQA